MMSMGGLLQWYEVDLSYNALTGPLPDSWAILAEVCRHSSLLQLQKGVLHYVAGILAMGTA